MGVLLYEYQHIPDHAFPYHFDEVVAYGNTAEVKASSQQWNLAMVWCETQFGPGAHHAEFGTLAEGTELPWAGRTSERHCNWIIFRHEVDAAAFRLVWG